MSRRVLSGGLLAVAGILVLLLVTGIALEGAHLGRIYPGVSAGGVGVGGLTPNQATARLQTSIRGPLDKSLALSYGNRVWHVSFSQLGLQYNVTSTVNAAYGVGRNAGFVERIGAQFLLPVLRPSVPLKYSVNETALQRVVDILAQQIDQPLQDARVTLTGADVKVIPAQEGRLLNRQATLTELHQRLSTLSTQPVALPVAVQQPATTNADAGKAVAIVKQWTAHDITLVSPRGIATLNRDSIAGAIRLAALRGAGSLQPEIDTAALRQLLVPLAQQVHQPQKDATFVVTDGTLTMTQPGQDGEALDLTAAVQAMTQAITSGATSVQLPIVIQHPALSGLQSVQSTATEVEALTHQPIELKAGDQSWTLSPADLSRFVTLAVTGQGAQEQLTASVDIQRLQSFVKTLADKIDQEPHDARLAWQNGALTVMTPSKAGRTLDVAAAVTAVQQAMSGTNRVVDLPVTVVQPKISSDHLDQLGIKEVVAAGTSNFSGSDTSRLQNIRRGAQLINGMVIAPGAVFSFDQTVGDISPANGFTNGLVILGHRTTEGIGGGICQVSTTLFRAAFWAGLPIVERHDHSYAVPYYTQGGYPEGFDATIYSPTLDLKIKNDTPAYLLIQTNMNVATNMLTVTLYGTKVNRQVKLIVGPVTNRIPHPPDRREYDPNLPKGVVKQVDWSHDGFDTYIERVIYQGSKQVSTDVFRSHYLPWQAVYLIGTGGAPAPTGGTTTTSTTTPAATPSRARVGTKVTR
ncbi:MAG: peptidoglycan binding domain-containing protein [Chloroflexi bacterium]|nr:peptidoglycan binding domain-containing protein [Chloroflexota bacterium]